MTGFQPFVPINLMSRLAVTELFACTPISQSITIAALLSTAFVSDVDGMFRSSGEWSALTSKLDAVGQALDQAKDSDGENWVADDKQAFVDAVVKFKGELENAKSMVGAVGNVMMGVAMAYAAYWLLVAAMAAAALVALIAIAVLFFTPAAPAAKAQAEAIGGFVASAIGVASKVATATFIAAGAIFTGAGVGMLAAKPLAEGFGGEKGADFKQAAINWNPPSKFEAKPKG